MSPSGVIVTYLCLWWVIFFMTLPWGVRSDDAPVPGSEPGAPAKPRLWIKAAVTTVLAGLVTWGVDWFVGAGFISLRPTTPPA